MTIWITETFVDNVQLFKIIWLLFEGVIQTPDEKVIESWVMLGGNKSRRLETFCRDIE